MPLGSEFTLMMITLAGICETSPFRVCQTPTPSLSPETKQSQFMCRLFCFALFFLLITKILALWVFHNQIE